jgi:hypothetical protein
MKRLIVLTSVLSLLLVSAALGHEPGDTLWTRVYGGELNDNGLAVDQTTDGGYILAGLTYTFGEAGDVYVVKTDASGDTLWTRTYGGSDFDRAYTVEQTTDEGYILGGETSSFGAGSRDVYLVKTDASGNTVWARTYGGTDFDLAYCAGQTSDGGYMAAGYTNSFGAGGSDFYLVKTDANGDTLWTRTYGGAGSEYAQWAHQTSDGGYILAGYVIMGGPPDVYLVKTDANGDTLWTRVHGGPAPDGGYCVEETDDGGYIVCGFTRSFVPSCDFYLLKTDANGDSLWTRTYRATNVDEDEAREVHQTTDGGYIIIGYSGYWLGDTDIYLVKTDREGDTLWTRTYGDTLIDYGASVQQTPDGGYIAAGYSWGLGAGECDFRLLRIAGEEVPAVSIEIAPDDPPVTVPQGGSFGYTGTVTNNTEDPQTTDIWVMAVGPLEGVYGPFKEFYDFPLDPGQSRSAHFNQHVHGQAPLGFYNYIAYCGDYPATVTDSSFFQIEVVEGVESGQGGWVLTGSFLEGDLADLPSEFALLSNYPNPFNASTVISYELPTEAHVKLEVYNISGQRVATLVDGQQEAGYRSVTWEDSEAASGVYFYKLTAGDFTEAKRMMLVK